MKILTIDNVSISSDEPQDTWEKMLEYLERAIKIGFKTGWFEKPKKEARKK